MTPDTGTLTQLLSAFLHVFDGGWSVLQPKAMSLFGILVGIELTLSGLWWAMSGNDAIKGLIQKLLVIGLFLFFIQQWQMLTTTTMQSFARAGAAAGGASAAPGSLNLADPSAIIAEGLNAIQPISDKADALTSGTWTALKNLGTLMQLGLAMIGILFAFFLIGIQCFLVYLEFYIVSILSLILLPFGVFRPTAFLAEKAFGAVLAHGIKLMVLSFIIAIAQPVLAAITVPADPSMHVAWCTLLAAMTICFLAWHAPSIAAGLLAGSPSLHAGHAVAPVLEAAGAIAMLSRGRGAGAAAGAGGESARLGPVGATLRAASAINTGAKLGANRAAQAGAGSVGKAFGAAGGAAKVAMSPLARAKAALAQNWKEGHTDTLRAHGREPNANAADVAASANPSGSNSRATSSGASSTSANVPGTPSATPPPVGDATAGDRGPARATNDASVGTKTDDGAMAHNRNTTTTQDAARLRPSERRMHDETPPELRPTTGPTLHRDAAARPGATDNTQHAADAAPLDTDAPPESKE